MTKYEKPNFFIGSKRYYCIIFKGFLWNCLFEDNNDYEILSCVLKKNLHKNNNIFYFSASLSNLDFENRNRKKHMLE